MHWALFMIVHRLLSLRFFEIGDMSGCQRMTLKFYKARSKMSGESLKQLVQRKLRWLGQVARRPDGGLIKDLLLPTPRGRIEGQLKSWVSTIKGD